MFIRLKMPLISADPLQSHNLFNVRSLSVSIKIA